ncbi:MAG TPA: hypothetical protein ENN90_08170 [Mariniphaga anaerophila]|uniref:Uncharacterized protein n=1 Tax=Mariniphaga anaerophila TaxID=1484053 RepID=A0A831LXE5_9BACT|nr:hypothetical protein [Mariniphaga anaerophila]
MKPFQHHYKFKLWEKLREKGLETTHPQNATLFFKGLGENASEKTAHVLYSKTVKPFSDQGSQQIEILSTGIFTLETSALLFRPDFYIFIFGQHTDSIHFIVIPRSDFIKKLEQGKKYPVFDKKLKLRFWLLPGNRLLETSDVDAEGEWYFLSGGGSMTEGTGMDFTPFLDQWNLLTK